MVESSRKESQRVAIPSFLSFILGVLLLAFGVILAVKANFGITVSTSLPYVFSLHFEHLTLGTMNYIIQGIVFFIMIIMIRKIEWQHVLCFVTNIIFGYTLDLFALLMKGVVFDTLMIRALGFAASIVVIGFALAFFIKSGLPLLPFDMFVRELAPRVGKRIGQVKTVFDLTLATCSLVASLVFFSKIQGIHIGTLVSALTIGTTIDIALHLLERFIHVDVKQTERINPVLKKEIISFGKK